MMPQQLAEARAVWRARRRPTRSDRAYGAYTVSLTIVTAALPVAHMTWVAMTGTRGLSALTSDLAPSVASLTALTLWILALLLGRYRGPAVLAPFLVYALALSWLPRRAVLCRPLLRAGATIAAVAAGSATYLGASLIRFGETQWIEATAFVAAAACAGIIATVLWLVGQVTPRVASLLALGMAAAGAASLLLPGGAALLPWAWVGLSYPTSALAAPALIGLLVLALGAAAFAPALSDRLSGMQLSAQAANWERATAFSYSFELDAALNVYESRPQHGRSLRAIRPRMPLVVNVCIRDIVGQIRTPLRFVASALTVSVSGALIAFSFAPESPTALMTAAAGLLLYMASGTLTRGLRYAAQVASDYPLFGVTDATLMLVHTPFPVAIMLLLSIGSTVIAALTSELSCGIAIAATCALGALILLARLCNALRGPLPPVLLSPAPTPIGDLSVVASLIWALSGPMVAAAGGLCAATLPSTPLPTVLIGVAATVGTLAAWKRRRT